MSHIIVLMDRSLDCSAALTLLAFGTVPKRRIMRCSAAGFVHANVRIDESLEPGCTQ